MEFDTLAELQAHFNAEHGGAAMPPVFPLSSLLPENGGDGSEGFVIDGMNDGRAFVNFVGHASTFAMGNLLTTADLDALTNGERLPVLTAQTCLAGQFGFPGVDAIGEQLDKGHWQQR